VEGRIEWDGRYDDRTPKFIIDEQEYTLEELGWMIMPCEGWNFKLEIIEPTEIEFVDGRAYSLLRPV
jgi:hypothetical protein